MAEILFPQGSLVNQGNNLVFRLTGFHALTKAIFGFVGRGSGSIITDANGDGQFFFQVGDPPGTYTMYVQTVQIFYSGQYIDTRRAEAEVTVQELPAAQVTQVHTVTVRVLNPFNVPLKPIADAIQSTITTLLIPFGRFQVVSSNFRSYTSAVGLNSGEINVVVNEFGSPGWPILVLTLLARLIKILLPFIVIVGALFITTKVLETAETISGDLVEQKRLDVIIQLNDMVREGIITPQEALEAEKTIFPEGVTDEDEDKGTSDLLETVTTFLPAIIAVAIVGAVVSLVPRARRED